MSKQTSGAAEETKCSCRVMIPRFRADGSVPRPQIASCRMHDAAPEMLEALRTIAYEPIGRSDASHEAVLNEIVLIARAAIAKTEGK